LSWTELLALADAHVLVLVTLLLGVAGVAFRAWLPHYVTKRVDLQFDSQLESHKSELQRLLEYDKFELQRKLTAGSLYMQKQHAAVAESYSAIRWAHGEVAGLFGIQQTVILRDLNRNDLVNLLAHYKVHGGKQDELLATYDADAASGITAVETYLFSTRLSRARSKLLDAQNLMYLNEIYFSDVTDDAFKNFLRVCNEWCLKSEFPPERGMPYVPYSRAELNGALDRMKLAMRAELTDPPNVAISPPHPVT